jgi:dihydroneopterin aldolase
MDTITIAGLEVNYHVGVPDAERVKPQRLLLNVEMTRDFQAAAAHDTLQHTIDYFTVAQRLLKFGQGRSWRLIETLAVEIAAQLLREFQPDTVTVEVQKFIIPEARYVSVRVTRRRS